MNDAVQEAVTYLMNRMGPAPRLGIILGSGLGRLVESLDKPKRAAFTEIPGFPRPTVPGHAGEVIMGSLNGVPLYVQAGRAHYYEGHDMGRVAVPMRVMAGLGVKSVIITNAAGAVNQNYNPGDLVALNDHINFMGNNPLRGQRGFRGPDHGLHQPPAQAGPPEGPGAGHHPAFRGVLRLCRPLL